MTKKLSLVIAFTTSFVAGVLFINILGGHWYDFTDNATSGENPPYIWHAGKIEM